jgi:Domain of unknown function (DUF222)
MFEPIASTLVDTFLGASDAGVVAAIGVAAQEENAACARRLEAVGELYTRRAPEDDTERTCWAIDGHENVVAEIAAELYISRGRARGQLRYAIHLRQKLPQPMTVFKTGAIDMRMVITIVNRVCLIQDPVLMTKVDAALAKWAPTWMRLSGPKLEERVDWWVERIDPAGPAIAGTQAARPLRGDLVYRFRIGRNRPAAARRRWCGAQAAADALADTVCGNDPRTKEERRADALGALAAGLTALRCECELLECRAALRSSGTNVVIHVLAEQSTVEGADSTSVTCPGTDRCPPVWCKTWRPRPRSSR